jgi:tetratricopeptide (TPR) repeat protein
MRKNPYAFLLRLGEEDARVFLVGLLALATLLAVAHTSTLTEADGLVALLIVAGAPLLATRLPGRGAPLFLLVAALGVMAVFRTTASTASAALPVVLALRVSHAAAPPLVLMLALGEEGRQRLGFGLLHLWAPAGALLVGSLVNLALEATGVGGGAEQVRWASVVCAVIYLVLIVAAMLWRVLRRQQEETETSVAMGRGATLEEQGRFGAAALVYEREGQAEAAAEAAKRAGDWARAARVYQKLGQPYEAGEMFSRAQQWTQALAAYEEARAWPAAARLSVQMGDVDRAAALLHKAGDAGSVVRLLEEAGRTPDGDQYRQAGRHSRAAEVFLAAGEWRRAADVLEHDLHDASEAARLHHEHGSYVAAGRLLESTGRLSDAAASYALAPEGVLDAARLLVRTGDVQQASALLSKLPGSQLEQVEDETTACVVARVMLETGREEGAARLLQGLKRRGAAGGVVHLLLGRAFLARNLPELAEQELRTAAHLPMTPEEEMQARYQLARTLESLGRHDEARSYYQELLQKDLAYADVQQRYRRLKEQPSQA